MATKKTEPKTTPALTEYIVLRQAQMTEVATAGDDVAEIVETAWLTVDRLVDGGPDLAKAWTPQVFKAASKQAAIRQHTGDGSDIVEGTFRAIPLSSWRGGVTTKRVMAAERLPLD